MRKPARVIIISFIFIFRDRCFAIVHAYAQAYISVYGTWLNAE